jgi:uncharacterized protein YndB with AHSA1/START domain
MNKRIEKRIELKASVERVWRALTDHREFSEWFRVKLEEPFVVGQVSRGRITHPGYEHVVWEALIEKIVPMQLFAFTWPHAKSLEKADYKDNYAGAPRTLVEFRLEKTAAGTLMTLCESGFDSVPDDWRLEAFRRNDGGWSEQMKSIESYVARKP